MWNAWIRCGVVFMSTPRRRASQLVYSNTRRTMGIAQIRGLSDERKSFENISNHITALTPGCSRRWEEWNNRSRAGGRVGVNRSITIFPCLTFLIRKLVLTKINFLINLILNRFHSAPLHSDTKCVCFGRLADRSWLQSNSNNWLICMLMINN